MIVQGVVPFFVTIREYVRRRCGTVTAKGRQLAKIRRGYFSYLRRFVRHRGTFADLGGVAEPQIPLS
jgi:hypothetical protein